MMQSDTIPVDERLLKAMQLKLSDLAAMWRGNRNAPQAETIIRQYQAVLRCLIELGFHKPLDADSELPDRLMPSEYLDIFRQ